MRERLLGRIAIASIGLCMFVATSAYADIADSVNRIRSQGCRGAAGVRAELASDRALDKVAREWSRGGRLGDALETTRYRSQQSSSMRISGTSDERAIATMLAANYCKTIVDPAFTAVGVYRSGKETWIVVAKPLVVPRVEDAASTAKRVLSRVNEARAQARRCGNRSFDPAPPLVLSSMLNHAALVQAQDMAQHDHFEHEGTDGSTPSQRVTKTGYRWRTVGENIAVGSPTADDVVRGWLDSPGHCANIMNSQFTQMGIAFAINDKYRSGVYWSQVFARPLD